MPTHKIVTKSTDGRFVGREIVTQNGEATIESFTFNVIRESASRIIGPNYSVTFVVIQEGA